MKPSRNNAPSHCTSQPAADSYALGIDVGGTNMAGGIVEFPTGRVRAKKVIPTQSNRPGQEILSDALTLAQQLIRAGEQSGGELLGVGVGVAELVDLKERVTSGYRINWVGLPVKESFSRLAPAVVDADVRVAALGEAIWGAGQPYKLFLYVTVGTGISHALVQDKQPYAGARGNAELFASSALTTICTQCRAVLNPVLEDIASGPALVARYNQASHCRATQGEEVLAAATVGDDTAAAVVKSAGEALGSSVGLLVNILDPQAVVVGGGVGLCGGIYWSSFVASMRQHVWADNARDLPILPAALGVDAGFMGAAATVWRTREAPPADIQNSAFCRRR